MNDSIGRRDAIDSLQCEWCVEKINNLPSAELKTDDENELKFYYVESLDDYWVGRRLDNFYYANWHEGLGFVWSHSKYLPWGEHIVDENTLWKEHTYPSEPIEIPFTEWIVGFVKKYFAEPNPLCALADRECPFQGKEYAWCLTCPHISEEDRELIKKAVAEPKTGEWIYVDNESVSELWSCSGCGQWSFGRTNYCPNCGADMRGKKHE